MKSNSGAKKRFKVTGTGRIKRGKAYHNHCLGHKSRKQKRNLAKTGLVHKSFEHMVKRMLLLA